MSLPLVSVVLVTWNSAQWLSSCFGSLDEQEDVRLEIIVVDNGSTDETRQWIRDHQPAVHLIEFPENRGFSAANNVGIARASSDWILVLNTDVTLRPRFVTTLVAAIQADSELGGVAGKLLAADGCAGPNLQRLDTSGEVVSRALRFGNRGAGCLDGPDFDERTEVFGVSAAAALYRREMLDDLRDGGDYFDSDFFSYLEDSDLNWRARLLGWRFQYVPEAVGRHDRQHASSRSLSIRRHAFANRYLMIVKNASAGTVLRLTPHLLLFEVARLIRTVFQQPALLPAYAKPIRLLPRLVAKRRRIQARRRIDPAAFRGWLTDEDYAAEFHRLTRSG